MITPENQAVVQSGSVELQCKVDQSDAVSGYISWEECITATDGTCKRISNDMNIIYDAIGGEPGRSQRYSITNPEDKQYNLKISDILPEDAGKYQCLSRNSNSVNKYVEVVVLGEYCFKLIN